MGHSCIFSNSNLDELEPEFLVILLRILVNVLNLKINTNIINDVKVTTYNNRIYIPHSLQRDTMNWYYHYLQYPGASRMEKTLDLVIYWPNMFKDIRCLCTTCKLCQLAKCTKGKYSKFPPKDLKTFTMSFLYPGFLVRRPRRLGMVIGTM